WQLLREQPSLARRAFQETMRRDVAPQPLFRTTTRSVELGGATLEEGRKVLVLLGAGNPDPRRLEESDRFDIRRDASGHLGFGTGIHACPGQTLAMLEGECLLGALARQVERIELDGEPVRRANNTLHTWAKLPVRVSASAHTPWGRSPPRRQPQARGPGRSRAAGAQRRDRRDARPTRRRTAAPRGSTAPRSGPPRDRRRRRPARRRRCGRRS